MRDQVRLLGILYILYHGLSFAVILLAALVVGAAGLFSGDFEAFAITSMVACGLAILAMVTVLPGIIAGWGLLKFRPWARILAIVVALFDLWSIPFGTLLAIYAMYVLFSGKSDHVFSRYGYYYG